MNDLEHAHANRNMCVRIYAAQYGGNVDLRSGSKYSANEKPQGSGLMRELHNYGGFLIEESLQCSSLQLKKSSILPVYILV